MHSRLCFALALFAGCGKPPDFTVRPTAGQLYVTHAEPGQTLDALSASGDVVESGVVDAQGSLVLRHLAAGSGWRVRLHGSSPERVTAPLTVTAVDAPPPPQSFYEQQHLVAGFNYLTMRDGTTLSAWVTLPPGAGPFPTVIAYAGYAMSRPGQPVSGAEFLCADFPTFCDAPEDPAALFASLFGYATVSVNMRGTGCSGGPYDYFEPLQVLDGYDVVETVAAQSWVRFHRPGMVGLSFPGIAQLFVASAQPPSLAAIAPMSVVESTNSTMRPGGLLNEGFALSWIDAVLSKAAPYGQGWERDRVDAGDDVCRENQLLHSQAVDNIAQARAAVFYDPAQQDHLNPHTFVDRISVPVFLSGSWQDEQTGPYFFRLFDRFTNAPALRLTASNGVHEDGFTPQVLIEWQQFLELFVAKRLPRDPQNVRNVSTFIFDSVFHSPLVLPPARFSKYASYDEALAAWKAEPTLRVIFETGAGRAGDPGAPIGTFEHGFTEYPPHEQQPRRLYFKLDGGMDPAAPTLPHAASVFLHDADAGTRTNVALSSAADVKLPDYVWPAPAPGSAVVFESEPFTQDTVLLGTASFDLWLAAGVDDADLQVSLTEVRADGSEVYLQSGWLRASQRTPGPDATVTWPAQAFLQADATALVPDEWVPVRVGTAGLGHALRAGSKVRAIIDTPGGTRARWQFALLPFANGTPYAIAHDATHPSSVVLPVIEGLAVPPTVPPCPGLRGQPCRAYTPYVNVPAN